MVLWVTDEDFLGTFCQCIFHPTPQKLFSTKLGFSNDQVCRLSAYDILESLELKKILWLLDWFGLKVNSQNQLAPLMVFTLANVKQESLGLSAFKIWRFTEKFVVFFNN